MCNAVTIMGLVVRP